MEDRKFLIISLVGSFLLIFGAVLFLSKSGGLAKPKVDPTLLVRADSHSKGDVNSKVTVVEFSDFQCPACRTAKSVVDQVLAQYGDKIRFVYRQFPLYQIHKFGERAAFASEYASENGKFWEYYNVMFDKQAEWSATDVDDKKFIEYLSTYAKSLGLDDQKMIEAVNSGKYKDRIAEDVNDGTALRLTGTPTFYVNGEELTGFSFDDFKSAIEKNLK